MAHTLRELLADCGLDEAPKAGQTKEASAAASTDEVDAVLKNLGLDSMETVKTASENVTNVKGDKPVSKSMQDLYGDILGESASAADEGQSKVASETETTETVVTETSEEQTDANRTLFGELVAENFNEALGSYAEKVAGDLEAEAGAGEKPMAHMQPSGGMTSVIGKPADPALAMNHSASGGEKLKATTGGKTPYSLKGPAMKEVLKRLSGAQPGGSYEQ